MNKKLTPRELGQMLDQSLLQIDADTLHRLQQIRSHALAARSQSRSVPLLAAVGQGFQFGGEHRLRYWMASLLLMLTLLAGMEYWQQNMQPDDAEADIGILTDDLPIEVFVEHD